MKYSSRAPWSADVTALAASAFKSAFVGAGGYGERIVSGLALNDNITLLAGAVPAAALALIVQGLFELGERRFSWRTGHA